MSGIVDLGGIEFPANSSNLAGLRQWTERIYRGVSPQCSDESVHALVLAVHEAARNVIEHAYGTRPGAIGIRAESVGDSVIVRLTHDGKPFDGITDGPVFDGTRGGGLGVYLMTQATSRVEYRTSADGKQCVELTKEIKRPTLDAFRAEQEKS